MANGDLHLLGTFYKAGVKQLVPTNPWRSGSTPGGGNIPVFSDGQSLEIRDTDPDSAYQLRWREVNIGSKKLLIADRNILEQVSWDDLNAQNLIFGKNVTIDGQQYKLRVLTGGEEKRGGGTGSSYDGGKLPNEWDDIIVNEGNYPGLPKPSTADLDSNLNDTDKNSAHNQFWNWYYMYSWCQETYLHDTASRAFRGYFSARFWDSYSSNSRLTDFGWRPVLEVLNSAPVISGTDADLGNKSTPFTVDYSVDDTDTDDVLTVTEKVDGTTLRTINNAIRGQTYTLDLSSIWTNLSLGSHTITITVDDGKGGTATRTYTFTKTDDRIKFTLKNPIETSTAAKKIVVSGVMTVPNGATLSVKACNNGFDASPTWEDITEAFLNREAYTFTNTTKTATKWGTNIEFEILKGIATEQIVVDGFGFAFEATPEEQRIYGVRIDKNNSNPETRVTYIGDAVGFTPMRGNNGNFSWGSWQSVFESFEIRPCVLKNKQVQYYLDPNDFTKKVDGSLADLTGTDGDVMIEFGKPLWWKWTDEGDTYTIEISNKKFDGAVKHAFEIEEGYNLVPYYALLLTQILFVIFFKSTDSQTALGRGYVDGNANFISTGNTNNKGMFYGSESGSQQMKFLGIEDYWGNKFWWIDGIVTDSSRNLLIGKGNFNDSGSGYQSFASGVSSDIDGYINSVQGGNEKGFVIKTNSGSATTYYADYGFLYSSRVAYFGGDRSYGSVAGFAYLRLNGSVSGLGATVGARLFCASNGKIYIGAYLGTSVDGKLRSISGTSEPTGSKTIGTFRTEARANN